MIRSYQEPHFVFAALIVRSNCAFGREASHFILLPFLAGWTTGTNIIKIYPFFLALNNLWLSSNIVVKFLLKCPKRLPIHATKMCYEFKANYYWPHFSHNGKSGG